MTESQERYKRIKKYLHSKKITNTGKMAEAWLRVQAGKTKIPSMTGTACYRFPDMLTDKELIEIKNVKHLRFTNQIQDFLLYSQANN